MECTTRTTGSLSIVEIAGAVDSRSAGQLYDVLVDIVRDSQSKLIVDLSKVQSMTRAGVSARRTMLWFAAKTTQRSPPTVQCPFEVSRWGEIDASDLAAQQTDVIHCDPANPSTVLDGGFSRQNWRAPLQQKPH